MAQRGRKSAAALATVPTVVGRPPAIVAPASLDKRELEVWASVVDRAPLGWFQPEQVDLVAAYCRHMANFTRLHEAAHADKEITVAEFAKLIALAGQESSRALAYARSLRLTTQARIAPLTAGRKTRRPSLLHERPV